MLPGNNTILDKSMEFAFYRHVILCYNKRVVQKERM